MSEPFPAQAARTAGREQRQPVAIPGIILDFLHRATVAVVGTRDENLVPHVHRVSGWQVEADRSSMTCFIPAQFTQHLERALESNGHVAMTVEEIGPHETYQFKGHYLGSRPCTEEDATLCRQIQNRFARVLAPRYGCTEQEAFDFGTTPSLAVTFAIEAIYLQTPGPGAGKRLAPPEDE